MNIHPYTGVPISALDITRMLKAWVLPQAFNLNDLYMKYEQRPIPSPSLSPHWPENSIQYLSAPGFLLNTGGLFLGVHLKHLGCWHVSPVQSKLWSWPCFRQEVGPEDLQGSLPTYIFFLWSIKKRLQADLVSEMMLRPDCELHCNVKAKPREKFICASEIRIQLDF